MEVDGCESGRGGLAVLGSELLHLAVLRGLVVAPALIRPVADAAVRRVVVRDLDDKLGPQGDPLEVTLVVPAPGVARAALARLVGARVSGSSRFRATFRGRRYARPRATRPLVVEAEDQRADRSLLLAWAPAHDDAVHRPDALDLGHAVALAGGVAGVRRLAITPSALCSQGWASSGDLVCPARGRRARRAFASRAPRRTGLLSSSRRRRQQVERDERVGVGSASICTRDSAGWRRWRARRSPGGPEGQRS